MDELITPTPSGMKFKIGSKADFDQISEMDYGTIYYCTDEEKYYMATPDGAQEINFSPEGKGLEMNLYDLNKNIMSQMEPLTRSEISMKMGMITDYASRVKDSYHMLLCRDYNYYTIFAWDHMTTFPDFASAVCNIITELGDVYSIEEAEGSALEIWIKPAGEVEPYAFYLFPYDAGVVYYG